MERSLHANPPVDLTRVKSAFENYGRHHPWCASLVDAPPASCNCGFAQEIAAIALASRSSVESPTGEAGDATLSNEAKVALFCELYNENCNRFGYDPIESPEDEDLGLAAAIVGGIIDRITQRLARSSSGTPDTLTREERAVVEKWTREVVTSKVASPYRTEMQALLAFVCRLTGEKPNG
jgi:hypothetical protein